ncbi:MAG: DUF1302 family protein [Pseudomonadota bacterium]
MNYLKNILFVSAFLFVFVSNSFALDFFDGQLHEVKGRVQQTMNIRTHQDFRDIKINSFRTMLRLEGLLDITKQPNYNIGLYGLFNFWSDSATSIDGGLKRAIRREADGSRGLHSFRWANEEQEIIKEFYLDTKIGSWFNVRLGKQLVSWGETAETRVADLINPLDFSNLTAFPDWEDYKVGLWMGRFFITPPDMPQDMTFEFIVIPYIFEEDRYPVGGSGAFIGSAYSPYTNGILHKRRHDKPSPSLSNTELGFRIRGLTLGADWALSVFNTRADTPLVRGIRGLQSQTLWIGGGRNEGDIFEYPFYTSYAATFARPIDAIKSTLRGEFVLNADRPYNYGSYKREDKDLFTSAITLDTNNFVPIISPLIRNRAIASSVSWIHYKLKDFKYNKRTGEYIKWDSGTRDSSWDKITLTLSTGIYYDTILPAFSFVYDFNGTTTYLYKLTVAPGDHWRYEVIFQKANEQGVKEFSDQVVLSLRYEF